MSAAATVKTAATFPRKVYGHSASTLSDGRVLVCGGSNYYNGKGDRTSAAHIYHPETDRWTRAAHMPKACWTHAQTPIVGDSGLQPGAAPDGGLVLVCGGYAGSDFYSNEAFVYDSAADQWLVIAPMKVGRAKHSASTLLDGRAMVCGGGVEGYKPTADVEIYDPKTYTWTSAAPVPCPIEGQSQSTLVDGRVLLIGETPRKYPAPPLAFIYDPAKDSWATATPREMGSHNAQVALANGCALVVGGRKMTQPNRETAIYNPSTGRWKAGPNLPLPLFHHTASMLPSGEVLVCGGDRAGNDYVDHVCRLNLGGFVDQAQLPAPPAPKSKPVPKPEPTPKSKPAPKPKPPPKPAVTKAPTSPPQLPASAEAASPLQQPEIEPNPEAPKPTKPEPAVEPQPPANAAAAPTAGRIMDFVHSDDVPSPIVGLFSESNPIVPIDAAVAPVGLDLAAQLYTAKKWGKKVGKKAIEGVPKMTLDMALAIWLYTAESPLYPTLNSLLRATDRSALKIRFFPYLRLLLEGLQCLRNSQGSPMRMVSRGVRLDLAGLHPDEYTHNETLIWWSLSSTTSNVAVLSNPIFLGQKGDRTIFQIMTTKAVSVSAFSAIQSEAELLLPPGVALRITGVLPKDSSGLTIITCEDDVQAPPMVA